MVIFSLYARGILFCFHTHLLSNFWTSRGHRCRPFFPPCSCLQVFIAHRLHSPIPLLVDFPSNVADSRSSAFRKSICVYIRSVCGLRMIDIFTRRFCLSLPRKGRLVYVTIDYIQTRLQLQRCNSGKPIHVATRHPAWETYTLSDSIWPQAIRHSSMYSYRQQAAYQVEM